MNVRRFVLRLAVGLLCFAVGYASAVLLGARRSARQRVFFVPHVEEMEDVPPVPFKTGCRAARARHAHEWREVPRGEKFEAELLPELEELPPPPPPPARAPRR